MYGDPDKEWVTVAGYRVPPLDVLGAPVSFVAAFLYIGGILGLLIVAAVAYETTEDYTADGSEGGGSGTVAEPRSGTDHHKDGEVWTSTPEGM